jgi:hypothetical protein
MVGKGASILAQRSKKGFQVGQVELRFSLNHFDIRISLKWSRVVEKKSLGAKGWSTCQPRTAPVAQFAATIDLEPHSIQQQPHKVP